MMRYFIGVFFWSVSIGVWGQNCAKYLQMGQTALESKDYDKAIYFLTKGTTLSDAAKCPTLDSKLAEARRAKAALAEKPKAAPAKPVAKPAVKVETSKPKPTAPNIEMVSVQGGTFEMGSNDSEAKSNEKPVYTVTVSNFQIGKYEVTQAQWRAVMGNSPSDFKNCDNCPVEQVSWDDIRQFLSKLNSMTGKRYRLPTEEEWEFAARGGTKSSSFKYSGSNDLNAVAWYDDNSGNKTHSVGTKQANELGLYDMSGNVWEWCEDRSHSYYSSSPQSNPIRHAKSLFRVLRGGSWDYNASNCRASYRGSKMPTDRYNYLGFRVVGSLQ